MIPASNSEVKPVVKRELDQIMDSLGPSIEEEGMRDLLNPNPNKWYENVSESFCQHPADDQTTMLRRTRTMMENPR